jgi:hypothetical protein
VPTAERFCEFGRNEILLCGKKPDVRERQYGDFVLFPLQQQSYLLP